MGLSKLGFAVGGRCYEGKAILSSCHGRAGSRVKGTARFRKTYEAPKRGRKRSMRVNGVDSANAGVDERESKPPAFQIIVLVRFVYVPGHRLFTSGQMSRHFLQSPLSIP